MKIILMSLASAYTHPKSKATVCEGDEVILTVLY